MADSSNSCTNEILKFHRAVLRHYEPSIHDGTVFLYQSETNTFWIGNQDSFEFLKRIDGISALDDICAKIAQLYEIGSDEAMDKVQTVVATLKAKGILVGENNVVKS